MSEIALASPKPNKSYFIAVEKLLINSTIKYILTGSGSSILLACDKEKNADFRTSHHSDRIQPMASNRNMLDIT